MSNRALWNIRQRHVWLAARQKKKPFKKRQRLRVGLQAALDRKAPAPQPEEQTTE